MSGAVAGAHESVDAHLLRTVKESVPTEKSIRHAQRGLNGVDHRLALGIVATGGITPRRTIAVGVELTEHARQSRQLAHEHRNDEVLWESSLRCSAVVGVMKTVNLGNLDDASGRERRGGP